VSWQLTATPGDLYTNSPEENQALGVLAAQARTWHATADPEHPLQVVEEGRRWVIRIGDFPGEPLYTLLIDGQRAGAFNNWPEAWSREGALPVALRTVKLDE
jgi:hypothetical protein